jgi:hypothetical protein
MHKEPEAICPGDNKTGYKYKDYYVDPMQSIFKEWSQKLPIGWMPIRELLLSPGPRTDRLTWRSGIGATLGG